MKSNGVVVAPGRTGGGGGNEMTPPVIADQGASRRGAITGSRMREPEEGPVPTGRRYEFALYFPHTP
jgi:hypothetical protein